MPATLEQITRAFAAKYPRPSLHRYGKAPGKTDTWDQMCGSLMNRMCEAYGNAPTGAISSAYIVYERSKIVSKDASKALPGDFHWWAIAGRLNGHVGLDVLGRGRVVFMATNSVTTSLGAGIGFLSVAGYTKAKAGRAVYLGHSRGYANGDVTAFSLPTAQAGTDTTTPLPPVTPAPTRKKKSMTTGYHTTRPGKPMEWALAGDGVGDAAWIPVGNAAAQELAAVHGSFVELTPASFDAFKARYMSARPAAAPAVVKGDNVIANVDPAVVAQVLAAVNALPAAIRGRAL